MPSHIWDASNEQCTHTKNVFKNICIISWTFFITNMKFWGVFLRIEQPKNPAFNKPWAIFDHQVFSGLTPTVFITVAVKHWQHLDYVTFMCWRKSFILTLLFVPPWNSAGSTTSAFPEKSCVQRNGMVLWADMEKWSTFSFTAVNIS